MLKKILLTSILFVLSIVASVAAPTADQILNRVSDLFLKSPSVSLSFSLKNGQGTPIKGSMTMCKDRFTATYDNQSLWFDGKTLWLFQKSANEVSISEPTKTELAECNPFYLISNYKKLYSASVIKKTSPGTYKVRLTPKKKMSDIQYIDIVVNDTSYKPVRIVTVISSDMQASFIIGKVEKGKKLPDSYFRFNTKNNPHVTVNDLR